MPWIIDKIRDILPNRPYGKTARDFRVARLIDINRVVEDVNTSLSEVETAILSIPAGPQGVQGFQGPQGIPGPVGPAGLNWQGTWSAGSTYVVDDAVGYNGASWFCINPVGPLATPPDADPTNWALLAQQGATGPQGPQGIQGIPGTSGSAPGYGQIIGNFGNAQALSGNDIITIAGNNGIITSISDGSPDTVIIRGTFVFEIGEYVPSYGGIIVHRWASTTSYGTPSVTSIPPTQNYIIMDLADLSTAQWGLNGTDVTNAESTWDGFTNTAAIVSTPGSGGFAASICDTSTNGGKTDWYLPSIDELSMIWQNRFLINLNQGVTPGFVPLNYLNYWSSTEFAAGSAWALHFYYGSTNTYGKNLINSVRAVRRVSII